MEQYLRETPMLDFSAISIQRLIDDRHWEKADEYNRIKQIIAIGKSLILLFSLLLYYLYVDKDY